MSAPVIKTPLTYGDALELATEATIETVKGCSHAHPRAPERVAAELMRVDQASREQAREDVASGIYPLPPALPIHERACVRCSEFPAPIEVRDLRYGAAQFFCSTDCVMFRKEAQWEEWTRQSAASVAEPAAPEEPASAAAPPPPIDLMEAVKASLARSAR